MVCAPSVETGEQWTRLSFRSVGISHGGPGLTAALACCRVERLVRASVHLTGRPERVVR